MQQLSFVGSSLHTDSRSAPLIKSGDDDYDGPAILQEGAKSGHEEIATGLMSRNLFHGFIRDLGSWSSPISGQDEIIGNWGFSSVGYRPN